MHFALIIVAASAFSPGALPGRTPLAAAHLPGAFRAAAQCTIEFAEPRERRLLRTLVTWPTAARKRACLRIADTLAVVLTRRRSATHTWVSRRFRRSAKPGRFAPSREQLEIRHELIRRLVWLDAEGQLQRFVRALEGGRGRIEVERIMSEPWAAGDAVGAAIGGAVEALEVQLRSFRRREPLIQWYLKSYDPQQPRGAYDECAVAYSSSACRARVDEYRYEMKYQPAPWPLQDFLLIKAFVPESVMLMCTSPTCNVHTIAILVHDYCTIHDSPPDPPLVYAIHHTILIMAISCKGQLVPNYEPLSCISMLRTTTPTPLATSPTTTSPPRPSLRAQRGAPRDGALLFRPRL